jgi:predicted 3-demethylubiquinone-9 3-methyltransferase (glyoxalase superfamily)
MAQKITTYLWFDKNAEEAMNFYTSVFKDSKIISITRYPEGFSEGPMAGMEGKVIHGIFELFGQQFYCLDGGPIFKFNESVSLYVDCEDQAEVDYYWEKLSAVPESEQCGWLKDKFGLSWQIIPKQLGEYLGGPDKEGANRATQAMLQMKKIVVEDLKKAYEGK